MDRDDTVSSGTDVSKEGRVSGNKEYLTVSHAAEKSNRLQEKCPLV